MIKKKIGPSTNLNSYPISTGDNSQNKYSQSSTPGSLNNGYSSVLENLLDHLDLTQKGWTSKLASRIEKAFVNGGEEIEFNLKPKNLGVLKISLTLNKGLGKVNIITENSFVTNALQQNESLLQKLFNDQGIDLDFTAHNGNQNSGSKNNFGQSENNFKEHKRNENNVTKGSSKKINDLDTNNSSRHIVNVIA